MVVDVGDTVAQSTAFTVPIPGEIVIVVAPSTFQHSCDDPPTLIVVGLSENCRILAACPLLTVTMTGALTEVAPSAPVAVRV